MKTMFKEEFVNYKEVLNDVISEMKYLFNGDVINSNDFECTKIIDTERISTNFIIEIIDDIYNKSILSMMDRSVILPDLNNKEIQDLYQLSDKLLERDIRADFLYISFVQKIIKKRALPSYIYPLSSGVIPMEIMETKHIESTLDEYVVYLTDNPIQSFVYIIQNMDYIIDGSKHTIKYKTYNCDYRSYKVSLKDLNKIRRDKIDSILS